AGSDPRALDEARLEEQLRIGQKRTSRSLRSHFAIVARATRAGTTTTRTAPEPRRHEEIRRTRRNVCVRFSTKVFFVDLRVFVSSWFRLSSCLRGSGSLRVLVVPDRVRWRARRSRGRRFSQSSRRRAGSAPPVPPRHPNRPLPPTPSSHPSS